MSKVCLKVQIDIKFGLFASCVFRMWGLEVFLVVSAALWIVEAFQQNKYILTQENVTIDEINYNTVQAAHAGVYKFNDTTNALNLTFTLKNDLPQDSKVFATALKWLNNDYRLGLLQISKSIHQALDMESFDLQTLFNNHCRPPLLWPVEKQVTYHCLGWIPDSSKFPPNLPEGKWKVVLTFSYANKTKLAVANWYLKLQNK